MLIASCLLPGFAGFDFSLKTCNAGKGWDGPTGVGTPIGLGAFLTVPKA